MPDDQGSSTMAGDRTFLPGDGEMAASHSPLPGDDGGVGGMHCVVTEDTERVIGERRIGLLHELEADLAGVNLEAEACERLARRLEAVPRDLPFASRGARPC